MCGIAGTVFYKGTRLVGRVEPQKLINEIKRVKDGRGSVSHLLDLVWDYKNNLNFLHYWNSPLERLKISQAAENVAALISCLEKQIKATSRSNKRDDFDALMTDVEFARDVLWILSKEVPRIRQQVLDIVMSDEIGPSKEALLLFKSIAHIINSIDFRLEIRGRDSLGLSVVLVSNSFLDHKKNENPEFDNSVLVDFESVGTVGVYTFVFKTFNQIGGLGDNAKVIRKLIRENKQFQALVCSGEVEVSSIVAHTRWASVGRIDFPNTLPLGTRITNVSGETTTVTSCLNGDILNHLELVNGIDSRRVCEFGIHPNESIKCTSDCLALPALLSNRSDYSRLSTLGSLEKAEGSFVVVLQESHYPGEVLIFKRGIQGLYIGKCTDGVFFASDTYGFVETCRDYCSVGSETFLLISEADDKHDVKRASVLRLKNDKAKTKTLYDGVFYRTEISTRDIDIGEYNFFLEKEINETRHIVEKTIHSFLHFHEGHNPPTLDHSFVISDVEVPEVIVNGLMEGNIKNIIITGMGTCYTAAVAISGYMRSMLQTVLPNLLVEPHVATEGSGFYLKPDMRDTLVIVVAQSGTTVDTNVFVKVAKSRGASALAIANKREGDVTFLVDGTLYIGNGRDIEIAVASTKTYTAHLTLGFLLTLFLLSKVKLTVDIETVVNREVRNLKLLPDLIEKSLSEVVSGLDCEKIGLQACSSSSWYVVRAGTVVGVCAEEIRIKISENCYQSVASLSIEECLDLAVSDAFIVLLTDGDLKNYEADIKTLVSRSNLLTIIHVGNAPESFIQDAECQQAIHLLKLSNELPSFAGFSAILAGQFLSFVIAVQLDKRKLMFSNLKQHLTDPNELKRHWANFYREYELGWYRNGFQLSDIENLTELISRFLSSESSAFDKDQLDVLLHRLHEHTVRTIDTVRHQAKTITVGAVRGNADNPNKFQVPLTKSFSENYLVALIKQIQEPFKSIAEFISNRRFAHITNVLIVCDNLDEAVGYNLVNLINDYTKYSSSSYDARLARDYDLRHLNEKKDVFWIFLSDSSSDQAAGPKAEAHGNHILSFNFCDWSPSDQTKKVFAINAKSSRDYQKAIWSSLLGLSIGIQKTTQESSERICEGQGYEKLRGAILLEINRFKSCVTQIDNSSEIRESLSLAGEKFLAQANIKTLGSGPNYNIAKYAAKKIIREIKRSCVSDVLENHKHIDMSAEACVLVFLANILNGGYQKDALSEIEKMLSHNTLPIIVTNQGDLRFDGLFYNIPDNSGQNLKKAVPVVKIPPVFDFFHYPVHVRLVEEFVAEMNDNQAA